MSNSTLLAHGLTAPELPDLNYPNPPTDRLGLGGVDQLLTSVDDVFVAGDLQLDDQGKLMKKYYAASNRSRSTIADFNAYLRLIPRIIASKVIYLQNGQTIHFKDPIFVPPTYKEEIDGQQYIRRLTPQNARILKADYEAQIYASVVKRDADGNEIARYTRGGRDQKILLGSYPIMLGSDICILSKMNDEQRFRLGESEGDILSYFLPQSEYVLMNTDQMRQNRFFCFRLREKVSPSSQKVKTTLRCYMTCDDPFGTKQMNMTESGDVIVARCTINTEDRALDYHVNVICFCQFLDPSLTVDEIISQLLALAPKKIHTRLRAALYETEKNARSSDFRSVVIDKISAVKEILIDKQAPEVFRDIGELLIQTDIRREEKKMNARKNISVPKIRLTPSDAERLYRQEFLIGTFPQIPNEEVSRKVTGMICGLYKLLLTKLNIIQPDSRDNWSNKYIKTPGEILYRRWTKFFHKAIVKFSDSIKNSSDVDISSIDKFDPVRSLSSCFRTNDWGMDKSKDSQNFSQRLERKSLPDTIAQINRILSPSGAKSHNADMRQVYGDIIIGPSAGQDGDIGKNKPKAITTWFTIPQYAGNVFLSVVLNTGVLNPSQASTHTTACYINELHSGYCDIKKLPAVLDSEGISYEIRGDGVHIEVNEYTMFSGTWVQQVRSNTFSSAFFYNGGFVGWCQPKQLKAQLTEMKLSGNLPRTSCIVHDLALNMLFLYTDQGRPTSMLLTTNPKTGRLIMDEKELWGEVKWDRILAEKAVTYLDAWELEQPDTLLATRVEYIRDAQKELEEANRLLEQFRSEKKARADSFYIMQTDDGQEKYLTMPEVKEFSAKRKEKLQKKITEQESELQRLRTAEKEATLQLKSLPTVEQQLQPMRERFLARLRGDQAALDALQIQYAEATERQLQLEEQARSGTPSERERAIVEYRTRRSELTQLQMQIETQKSRLHNVDERQMVSMLESRARDRLQQHRSTLEVQIKGYQASAANAEEKLNALRKETEREPNAVLADREIERLEEKKRRLQYENSYTHCLLDPNAFLSIVTAAMPFSDHNQAPRNTLGGKMNRQAAGMRNPMRFDTSAVSLAMPQANLSTTQMFQIEGLTKSPATQLVWIAIMNAAGWNQEDGLVVKKSWVERGGGATIVDHSYSASREKGGTNQRGVKVIEHFAIPPEEIRYSDRSIYALIDPSTGAARRGGRLRKGIRRCIIAKYSETRSQSSTVFRDLSTYVSVEGVIDAVSVSSAGSKQQIFVKVSEYRPLREGNKVSSQSAQKEIVTKILPDEEMPALYDPNSDTTLIPDIIMNPLAMPTRMTVSQLLHQYLGFYTIETGRTGDASAFKDFSLAAQRQLLEELGADSSGMFIMQYDPISGEPVDIPIAAAPLSYNILKHMVADKIQARGIEGPRAENKQPKDDGAKRGGVRTGEMEKDIFFSYGASEILQERSVKSSDNTTTLFCETCQSRIYKPAGENAHCFVCEREGREAKPLSVPLAYAMLQYSEQMSVYGVQIGPVVAEKKPFQLYSPEEERSVAVPETVAKKVKAPSRKAGSSIRSRGLPTGRRRK